jgi:osmotically-inducible protein OsmY
MSTTSHAISDAQLATRVAQEIDADARLDDCQIRVDCNAGVVVLSGLVDASAARGQAEQAARRVPGVRDVANDLVVTPRGAEDRPDPEIAAAVRHALEWDVRVPQERITSSVTAGVVTLAGEVDRWSESRAAEGVVATLAGVRTVVNELRVAECVSPKDVHRAIVRALTRHALEQANRLDVGAFQGEVTISGDVGTASEKQLLLDAVRAVPGVCNVRSLIRVQSLERECGQGEPATQH